MAFLFVAGQRFGRLVVIERATQSHVRGDGSRLRMWTCRCECGRVLDVQAVNLARGKTRSCGCLWVDTIRARNSKHRMKDTPEYKAWSDMKSRCYRKTDTHFSYYGGRGITVCEQWLGEFGFETFFADVGKRPSPHHSIDRIDVNGNYEPGNVRWATDFTQQRNRRNTRRLTARGRTMTLTEWAAETGIPYCTIRRRLDRGLDAEAVLAA